MKWVATPLSRLRRARISLQNDQIGLNFLILDLILNSGVKHVTCAAFH